MIDKKKKLMKEEGIYQKYQLIELITTTLNYERVFFFIRKNACLSEQKPTDLAELWLSISW